MGNSSLNLEPAASFWGKFVIQILRYGIQGLILNLFALIVFLAFFRLFGLAPWAASLVASVFVAPLSAYVTAHWVFQAANVRWRERLIIMALISSASAASIELAVQYLHHPIGLLQFINLAFWSMLGFLASRRIALS